MFILSHLVLSTAKQEATPTLALLLRCPVRTEQQVT